MAGARAASARALAARRNSTPSRAARRSQWRDRGAESARAPPRARTAAARGSIRWPATCCFATARSRSSPHLPVARVRGLPRQAQARRARESRSRATWSPSSRARTAFLCDVGLGYLQLDRAAPTLSGGEAQRIRLAAQLGSNLQGVCYVLDEPTIGLHPRDNDVLLDTLERLRSKGNTLVVVEHDEETIRRADHVIDLGPGAGTRGGTRRGAGHRGRARRGSADSPTGRCLAAPLRAFAARAAGRSARDTPSCASAARACTTCAEVDARIPLGRLTRRHGRIRLGQILAGARRAARQLEAPAGARRRRGRRTARRAAVPSRAARRSTAGRRSAACSRSTRRPSARRRAPARRPTSASGIRSGGSMPRPPKPASADSPPAAFRSIRAGGRCEACEGQGMQRIEMSFLPDVQVLCDVCGGRRFNRETLGILFKGKSIGETLAHRAWTRRWSSSPPSRSIQHPVQLLADVGSRLPEPRPAEPDALRRREPAHQARGRARQGAHRRRRASTSRAARASTPCTCSTSRRSGCTWRTWRS